MTATHLIARILQPFYFLRLRRNVRAWLPAACRDPKSVEAQFVAEWSVTLRLVFGS